jgi:Zinc carboxypeptidase
VTAGPLPELDAIEDLARDPAVRADVIAQGGGFPIHALTFGHSGPHAPALLVTAGVHGLERVGTHVAIAYLRTLVAQLAWDQVLHGALGHSRIVVVPLVNPGGMAARTRANPRGVDLMRNAPVATGTLAMPMIGGQRVSARLPWYMGAAGEPMQPEARALCDLTERIAATSSFTIAIDLHSGFGLVDRLWFPYARTRTPAPRIAETLALRRLLDRTLPNHVYHVEPTARVYTIRGDLWDHLTDRAVSSGRVLLPFTLEMGSWAWLRKHPLQALSRLGPFNPTVPHRLRRTLRRHLPLLDFLHRAAISAPAWATFDAGARARLEADAFAEWYAT